MVLVFAVKAARGQYVNKRRVVHLPRAFDFFAAFRESRGKVWPTTLLARCSGLHSLSRLADFRQLLAALLDARLDDAEQNAAMLGGGGTDELDAREYRCPPGGLLCINVSS